MSGQKINDHKFFAGGKSEGSVFPKGVHHKMEKTAEGAGAEHKYEDTSEAIREAQEMAAKKAKSHETKHGYRN